MKTQVRNAPIPFFLLSFAVMFLAACGGAPPAPPEPTVFPLEISIQASADVNPDIDNRPSPVILHMLELSAIDDFNQADFFALTKDDASVLGGDLLNKTEIILTPGSSRQLSLEVDKKTRYIGFVAGYRDIDNSRWRVSKEIVPGTTSGISVNIGDQQVSIN